MNQTNPRRAALIASLRAAHRCEPTEPELRRRVLERLEREQQRARYGAWLPPRASLAFSLLALAAGVFWLQSQGTLDLGLGASRLRLGPEPQARDGVKAAPPTAADDPAAERLSARPCPLQETPPGAVIAPELLRPNSGNVAVHTFEMQTPRCGPLRRRYLAFVPAALGPRSSAPVLIALPDRGQSAELLQSERTRWRFEHVAQRAGAVLVYANAAPGRGTDPRVANSGTWQTDPAAHPEVDDEAYLLQILRDLQGRGVLGGGNTVYLVGDGAGADMALAAAAHRREVFTGVAAFFPHSPTAPEPALGAGSSLLTRVLLVRHRDPEDWLEPMGQMEGETWARSLGISGGPLATRGENLALVPAPGAAGAPSSADAPYLLRWDRTEPTSGGAAVRLLMLDRRADPFPTDVPRAKGAAAPFDAAIETWTFLSGADGLPVGSPAAGN